MGTPEYISPEQAEASGLEVDTTTDIYSLASCSTSADGRAALRRRDAAPGRLRRDAPDHPRGGPAEAEPAHHGAGAMGRTSRASIRRRRRRWEATAGDLDAIAMKAMEKDRTRRYASASEFAADITRYLNGEASSPAASVLYRARKFVRRTAWGGGGGLVFVSLVVGLTVSMAFYLRSEAARRQPIEPGPRPRRSEPRRSSNARRPSPSGARPSRQ